MTHSVDGFPKVASKIWLFRLASGLSVSYIITQLFVFHFQLASPPLEFQNMWFAALLSYTVIKEAFRWFDLLDKRATRHGELYAGLLIGVYLWMILFNVIQQWAFGLPYIPLPHGYAESVNEVLLVLTASYISFAAKEFMRRRAKKHEQERTEKTPAPPLTE